MNRAERRKWAKKLRVAPELVSTIDKILNETNGVPPLEAGQKVKLNVEKILKHEAVLKEDYLTFVKEHANDVWTVEGNVEWFKHFVTLVEDETVPKWYWKTTDLIKVEQEE